LHIVRTPCPERKKRLPPLRSKAAKSNPAMAGFYSQPLKKAPEIRACALPLKEK
jgi:hypothetical protein